MDVSTAVTASQATARGTSRSARLLMVLLVASTGLVSQLAASTVARADDGVVAEWSGSTLLGVAKNDWHWWGQCRVRDMNGGTWPIGDSGNWSFSFPDGRYRMTMVAGLGSVWSYGGPLPGTNVVLAADVEARAGSAGLLFGFIDANNYYRFMLGADGTWALQQRTAAGISLLRSGDGLGPGRMIVAQRGAVTHLYWNTTYLGEVVLAAFPAGNYGFTLASPAASEGYFDNLRIRQLP